jgi:DNA-binding MarR family transcriptional regulator
MAEAAKPKARLSDVLKQIDRLGRQLMDLRLRALGIDTSYPAAAALCQLGEQPGLSGAELARGAMVTPQTMNPILTRLEQDGLIVREPHPVHGRILCCHLTKKGRAEYQRAESLADAMIADMQHGMKAGDRSEFLRLLSICRDNLAGLLHEAKAGDGEAGPARKAARAQGPR